MTQNGWRKPTPGLGAAEQLAQAGEHISFSKTKCIVAVKRVGVHIGLKAADLMLLDTLTAFSQAQDWEEGRRPIVWASNAYLMERTGFSLSALKRHVRRLAEAGVISFAESPNGKRWGHRDANGHIVEAYGFDLAPLAARVEEFDALYVELTAERALCQRLKQQITIARRMLRSRIEAALENALTGPWEGFMDHLEGLLSLLPRRKTTSDALKQLLDRFRALQQHVQNAFSSNLEDISETLSDHRQANVHKLDPSEVISEPHIQTTKELISVTCNSLEATNATSVGLRAKATAITAVVPMENERKTSVHHTNVLNLNMVMRACPEFACWARDLGSFVHDWTTFHRIAGQIRPMIGVTEQAWNSAQRQMGKQKASAALALVFEKFNAGEVSSPGGYLRGMIARDRVGELHLERSFYGRLNAIAA